MSNFRQIPDEVLRSENMTIEGVRIFAAVQFFDRGGRNGRGCFASPAAIAKWARCDISTVKRWLKKLVALGFLKVERGGGRGNTNTYRVVNDMEKGGSVAPLSDDEMGAAVHINRGSLENNVFEKQEANHSKDRRKDSRVKREKDSAVETAPFSGENGASPFRIPTGNEDDDAGIGLLNLWDDDAFLAKLDREVNGGGRRFQQDIAEAIYARLESLHCDYSKGDPVAGRAYRLLQTDICREGACYDGDGIPTWHRKEAVA